MKTTNLNSERKQRSSTSVKTEEENGGIWSRWAKAALGSCMLWRSHVKEKPLREMATEEGQACSLKYEDRAVQEISTRGEIVTAHGSRSNLRRRKEELQKNFQHTHEMCKKNKKQTLIWNDARCKKGRLRRLSKTWIRRKKTQRKSRKAGQLEGDMEVKMAMTAGQQMIRGECSYSAYMGTSVEEKVDMRHQETTRADGLVTRKEWEGFIKEIQALVTAKKHSRQSNANEEITKPIIIDSGATHHMISDRSLMSDIKATTGSVK